VDLRRALACRTDQVNVDTDERRLLAPEPLRLEPIGPNRFRAFGIDRPDRRRDYQVVDGWLERLTEAGPTPTAQGSVDTTGVSVTVEGAAIVFRLPDGSTAATIGSPVDVGRPLLAFVEGR